MEWDDSNDKIMDIIDELKSSNIQIPLKCPICGCNSGHVYMHRWEGDRGTIWAWCSSCKACMHGRFKLPKWWSNSEDINVSELTAHPIFLEPKAKLIDQHIKKLLTNINCGDNT